MNLHALCSTVSTQMHAGVLHYLFAGVVSRQSVQAVLATGWWTRTARSARAIVLRMRGVDLVGADESERSVRASGQEFRRALAGLANLPVAAVVAPEHLQLFRWYAMALADEGVIYRAFTDEGRAHRWALEQAALLQQQEQYWQAQQSAAPARTPAAALLGH